MSGSGILGIGVSALLAAQRALAVTAHNVANAGTEGYSRERVDLSARPPSVAGFGAIGQGVQVDGVRRTVDDFVNLRLGMRLSDEAHARTVADFSKQIDNLLGDSQSGMAPALQKFFAAVQDMASDPTSTAARQQVISEGQSLLDRFSQLSSAIGDQQAIANGRIRSGVEEVGQLASSIADLNRSIVETQGRGGTPNDLLDKRDELVRKLSTKIDVQTVQQSDGSLNVYVGQGQPLVVGYDATPLTVRTRGGNPNLLSVGFQRGNTFIDATRFLGGGELGALIHVSDQVLEPASNELGRIELGLASAFNAVHRNNMDLDGQAGGDFFNVNLPPALAAGGNAATGTPQLAVADVGGLVASNYDLSFDGTDWNVRRLTDGQVVGTAAPGGTVNFDGLALDLSGVTGAAQGDRFALRPMQVADTISVRVTDPRDVAAALPVRAEAASANTGTAAVQSLMVIDATDPNLRTPVSITFTGGNFVFAGQTVAPDASGETTLQANGWSLTVKGTPAQGDVFSLRDNAGGVGDNRGALALAGLQYDRPLSGGTASFGESYGAMVADVGVTTQRAMTNADVQASLLGQAQAQRQSVSGVNLDEEAANLLKYQQAYQAGAQVIATAGKMLDTLFAVMSR